MNDYIYISEIIKKRFKKLSLCNGPNEPPSSESFLFEVTMKLIPLTQGKFAMVDDEDYPWLNQFKWHYSDNGCAGKYVNLGYKKETSIYMHRFILNTPKGMETDHKDLNRLNNQRHNIRICTTSQNKMNTKKFKGNYTSKYKGVHRAKGRRNWASKIVIKNKPIHLGCFKNEKDAAIAYNKAAEKLFGEFARLNEI